MSDYIRKLCIYFKKSNLSKSDKVITQLFINVCMWNKFYEASSGKIFLTKKNAEYFLNTKHDFASYGRESVKIYNQKKKETIKTKFSEFINLSEIRNLIYFISSSKNLLKVILKIFLVKSQKHKEKITFIFETKKCKNFWEFKKNIIFISLEDIKNISPKSKYLFSINHNLKYGIELDIKEIIKFSPQNTIKKHLSENKYNLKKNEKYFNSLNFLFVKFSFLIKRLLSILITKKDKVIFIDNTQGLLAAAYQAHEILDRDNSLILNCQHGSGYYEFLDDDFNFSEVSPAYDKPLIGFYQSKLIRPHYPVNGTHYALKNSAYENYSLIIEGADPFSRGINQKNLKLSKYNINLYNDLSKYFSKNGNKFLIRRHPKSKVDWARFEQNNFIENLENIPKKYIPNFENFESFILIGLGNSLIYPLIFSKKKFFVIADSNDYKLSQGGLNFVEFLEKNKLLYNPIEVSKFSNDYRSRIAKNHELNFSDFIDPDANILEEWIYELSRN